MPNKPELLYLPNQENSALAISETRASLIARARTDAKSLAPKELRAAVMMNGRWGIINQHGKFTLDPAYHDIRPFSCGRAAFSDLPLIYSPTHYNCDSYGRQDQGEPFELYRNLRSDALYEYDRYGGYKGARWGFLDVAGNTSVEARLTFARNFSEDLAGATLAGGYGFIDRDGLSAIEPRFEAVGDFKDGLAMVMYCGNCGFIDKTGQFAVLPLHKHAWEFSDGLACVEVGLRYGFISKEGELVIQPQFDFASDFHEGLAFVSSGGEYGYITTSGEAVIWGHFESASDFRDGLAKVTYNGNAGLIDRNGRIVYERENDELDLKLLGRGRVGVEVQEGRWAVTDISGEAICDYEFEHIGMYKEGLAVVKHEQRWGYIDEDGEIAVEPRFSLAMSFSSGLARVTEDEGWERWGFITEPEKQPFPASLKK